MSDTNTHRCAAKGCKAKVRGLCVMCPAHWRIVPISLRVAFADAFNDWRKIGGQDRVDALRSAQAACVDAVGRVRV